MTIRRYILTFSLSGSAVVTACWLSSEKSATTTETAPLKKAGVAARPARAETAPRSAVAGSKDSGRSVPALKTSDHPGSPAPAAAAVPLTAEELASHAARVEQEANHDLRRLVKLLDLNEQQQDRVFQTLAEHSSSWNPALAVAPAAGAATAGKRPADTVAATGTTTLTAPGASDKKVAMSLPTATASASSSVAAADPAMAEILALLEPAQQDTLLQAELDRAAWWAEILPQITPADDVPSIDGTNSGQTKSYDGAEVLE